MRKTSGIINFPMWVIGPTPCKTRTFSLVLPGTSARSGCHGAERIEHRFVNRPVSKARRIGLPGYYVKWADYGSPVCPETGYAECAERHCDLHYMDAPLRLETK